jgi:hypothetical protein
MKYFSLLIFAITFATSSSAADIDNGGELHSESCTRCHDSAIYTREDRKVQSLSKLGTQVRFCKDNLGVTWFDDEVDDVIGFLNNKHYHF